MSEDLIVLFLGTVAIVFIFAFQWAWHSRAHYKNECEKLRDRIRQMLNGRTDR